jgi:hypothetical protein
MVKDDHRCIAAGFLQHALDGCMSIEVAVGYEQLVAA